MAPLSPTRLRVAAIGFLNPAPLMWDFEHPPRNAPLAERYRIHSTSPAQCALDLAEDRADLGLIPIAALTPALAIVPGCAIASLGDVRSIQLILKRRSGIETADELLASVRSLAADTASRSSLAYAQILFRRFLHADPAILPSVADPVAMLRQADAALLIGDPALLALERRAQIEEQAGAGPCLWLDLAHEWRRRTSLPWVAAVWAVRPESLRRLSAVQLTKDFEQSRSNGVAHIDEIVAEWTPRIALPPETIRHYLTRNIHYALDPPCIEAIALFRRYAAEAGILPPLPELRFV